MRPLADRRAFLLGVAGGSAAIPLGLLACSSRRRPDGDRGTANDLHGESDENVAIADPHDCGPLAWNDFLRRLVVARGFDPPFATRVYAYAALAQACAMAEPAGAGRDGAAFGRVASSTALLGVTYPLSGRLLPPRAHYDDLVEAEARRHGLAAARLAEASASGTGVASSILERMRSDRADEVREVEVPIGPARWRTDEHRPPIRPRWGSVRPMLVGVAELPPRSPPDPESHAFRDALEEVRERVRDVTPTQRRIVALWADASGTSTPAGHWNRIACRLARRYGRDDRAALDTLALSNLAMFDAGIACWHVKYKHWLARPTQLDPSIRPLLKLPNFPAYPSGHSAFSAAAAEVLASFYPRERLVLERLAQEASESRILAGIHYRFDCDEGLRIGRWVGHAAIARWRARGRFTTAAWV